MIRILAIALIFATIALGALHQTYKAYGYKRAYEASRGLLESQMRAKHCLPQLTHQVSKRKLSPPTFSAPTP